MSVGGDHCAELGSHLVVEVGTGTGYYLAHVVDAFPASVGVGLDVSRYALRRAARVHPRVGAVACDIAGMLPFADSSVSVLLDVFAPRNADEMRRVLRPGGRLLVVTPRAGHLAELVGPLGLVRVDERKDGRLADTLAGRFRLDARTELDLPMVLSADEATDLLAMGPSGHHVDPLDLRHRVHARWPGGVPVIASVTLARYTPISMAPNE